ncbi:MAG: Do family serine endopeptidase [Hyphomicrobiaceae bacterium]
MAGAVLGLVGAGLLGLSVLAPRTPALAQRAPDAGVLTPYGRAPLSFADLVDRVKPSVVSIHVTAAGPKAQAKGANPRGGQFPDLPDDHPLNEFFKNLPKEFRGQPNQGPQRPSQAQGSGFVISADGFVVTNNHVIDGGTRIQVSFDDQTKYDADLIGTDARTDIALLKIKDASKPFPFVKFSDKSARVGDWVLAVGNPFGLGGTVTAGIVSALARDIGSGPYDFLQIDAAVNRGNSGGPTFNLDGEVVGVNTAIYSPSGGNVGIAFAVPAKTAAEVVAQLRSGGTVSRGWLGVKIENVDEDKAASFGMKEAKGALINEITAGGPAAGSQLKAGDVVTAVNGQPIANSRDLARKVAELAPNTIANLEVFRFGKIETVQVKLGTFPGAAEVAKAPAPEAPKAAATKLAQLGLSLSLPPVAKAGSAREGVLISDVDVASDAAAKGLSKGDIILEVQGQPVKTVADVETGVQSAQGAGRKAVLLRVKSGEVVRFVAVQLKG